MKASLLDGTGNSVANLEEAEPLVLDVTLEAARDLVDPLFAFHIRNADAVMVSGFLRRYEGRIAEGRRVRLRAEIENLLVPGTYSIDTWIRRDRHTEDIAVQPVKLVQFVVYGTTPRHGMVSLRADIETSLEPE